MKPPLRTGQAGQRKTPFRDCWGNIRKTTVWTTAPQYWNKQQIIQLGHQP